MKKHESVRDNKVLIITYVFPPAAYVGGHRQLKYCKYLRDYGWAPLVLTIEPTGVNFKDDNLCRQVPDHVRVYRALDVDPAKWIEKFESRERSSTGVPPRIATAGPQAPPRAPGMLQRLRRLFGQLLNDSPDSHIFWVPFAFLKGVRILLTENVDVIYCSSPPHSSHIVAFLLAICFRKPYVLDFRDPWFVSGPHRIPSAKHRWVSKWETAAKRVVVSNAAKIISVSRGERDELREEFPELKAEHFTVITNGYDPTDFNGVSQGQERSSKLTLTHAGTIYGGRAGEFFASLHQLVRDHPGIEDKVQVKLIGEVANEYAETIRTLEARGILRAYGTLPHATTLRAVLESDALVILMGGEEELSSHIPAKVFEYLYAGKPIVAVAGDGELAEIVTKSGLGILVSPDSVEKLARTLWDLYADYATGRLVRVPNKSYIKSFERAALTGKLAMILDEVKGSRNDPR